MPAFGIDPRQAFPILQQRLQAQNAERASRAPASGQSVLDMLGQGASQGQQDLIQQIIDQRFNQGAQQLQDQARTLSSTLSSSAAGRGLGMSSIGRGQQDLLGRTIGQQLGNLQGGLQTAGAQQLFQLPQQNAQLALGLRGQDIGREFGLGQLDLQRQQMNQSRGGGLGGLLGGAAGSFFGPIGGMLGSSLGNSLFGGGGGGGGGQSFRMPIGSTPGSGQFNANIPL